MKTVFFSCKQFELPFLQAAQGQHNVVYLEQCLSANTVRLADGAEIVSVFTSDNVSAPVLESLYNLGVRYVSIRAAGYDNVDLVKAKSLGMMVANVPDYSPNAVAEHAVALILALNRKIVLADKQVHQMNFTTDNLIGFDLHHKTIGIVGTGRIGVVVAGILYGFGCRLLGYDKWQNPELIKKYNLQYVALDDLCKQADVITVHTPLTTETRYLINIDNIRLMRRGVMLINTSRGACVKTTDVIEALLSGQIGSFGADTYENEAGLFFFNHSGEALNDPVFNQLLSFSNVLITPHQAFATRDALVNIASTTFGYINCWEHHQPPRHQLTVVEFPITHAADIDDDEW